MRRRTQAGTALVVAIWSLAEDELKQMLKDALDKVKNN